MSTVSAASTTMPAREVCLNRTQDVCNATSSNVTCLWRTHCVGKNDPCEMIFTQSECKAQAGVGCTWTADGVCDMAGHACMTRDLEDCLADDECEIFDGCVAPRDNRVCQVPCGAPVMACMMNPSCAPAFQCSSANTQTCGAGWGCILPCLNATGTITPEASTLWYAAINCLHTCVNGKL